MLAWAIGFLGNMSYVTGNSTLTSLLSVWVIIFIMFRVLFEVVSLVENLAIISTESEQQSLARISKMLNKIVGIWQQQIEKKIDKYSI